MESDATSSEINFYSSLLYFYQVLQEQKVKK